MIPQLSQLQQSLHRACCCGNVCANCPDLLPSTIEFELAGLDITGCCERAGFGQSFLAVGAPSIDGTYTLSTGHSVAGLCGNGSDTCGFGYRENDIFDVETYANTTCGGGVLSTASNRISVTGRFYDDGGGIRLWVEIIIARTSGGSTPLAVFRGKTDVLTNCLDADGAVITNECVGCNAGTEANDVLKCWAGDGVFAGGQSFGDGAGTITVTL